MKLLSIASSKTVWLFPTNDLNPRGAFHPELMNNLRERYKVQVMPTPAQIHEFITKKQGITFAGGGFKWSGGEAAVSSTYFADGIMAETRAGTEAGDEFISDLLEWLATEHSMAPPNSIIIRKIYSSEVYVHMSHALNAINPKLNLFAATFAQSVNWPAPNLGFEVTGITISPNPAAKMNPPHPPFKLERDTNAPFEDARYYSAAPMRTEEHLALLAEFERAMTPKASSGRSRPS